MAFDAHQYFDRLQQLLAPAGFKFRLTRDSSEDFINNEPWVEGKSDQNNRARTYRHFAYSKKYQTKVGVSIYECRTNQNVRLELFVRDERGHFPRKRLVWDCIGDMQLPSPERVDKILDCMVKEITEHRGVEVEDAPVKNFSDLKRFPPIALDKPHLTKEKGGIYIINHNYTRAKVLGFVAIEDDLKITAASTQKPNSECWFLLSGNSVSGATLEIIVTDRDGQLVYYPIRHHRVTNDLTPKGTYIDYMDFTRLDKVLIEKAIAHFLAHL